MGKTSEMPRMVLETILKAIFKAILKAIQGANIGIRLLRNSMCQRPRSCQIYWMRAPRRGRFGFCGDSDGISERAGRASPR